MAVFGSVWQCLGGFGAFWQFLAMFVKFGGVLALFGVWHCLAVLGRFWGVLAVCASAGTLNLEPETLRPAEGSPELRIIPPAGFEPTT